VPVIRPQSAAADSWPDRPKCRINPTSERPGISSLEGAHSVFISRKRSDGQTIALYRLAV